MYAILQFCISKFVAFLEIFNIPFLDSSFTILELFLGTLLLIALIRVIYIGFNSGSENVSGVDSIIRFRKNKEIKRTSPQRIHLYRR